MRLRISSEDLSLAPGELKMKTLASSSKSEKVWLSWLLFWFNEPSPSESTTITFTLLSSSYTFRVYYLIHRPLVQGLMVGPTLKPFC